MSIWNHADSEQQFIGKNLKVSSKSADSALSICVAPGYFPWWSSKLFLGNGIWCRGWWRKGEQFWGNVSTIEQCGRVSTIKHKAEESLSKNASSFTTPFEFESFAWTWGDCMPLKMQDTEQFFHAKSSCNLWIFITTAIVWGCSQWHHHTFSSECVFV